MVGQQIAKIKLKELKGIEEKKGKASQESSTAVSIEVEYPVYHAPSPTQGWTVIQMYFVRLCHSNYGADNCCNTVGIDHD